MDGLKRYCKGCQFEVTDRMFCVCGEIGLTESMTYTESDLMEIETTPYGEGFQDGINFFNNRQLDCMSPYEWGTPENNDWNRGYTDGYEYSEKCYYSDGWVRTRIQT